MVLWNKVSHTPCLGAWYLFLRATAGLLQHHCSPDGESKLPMWTPWRYLNQNKHVQDNISLCRMPGKRKPLTWRVARLKPISGIFVELAGCLLTQNELISPRRTLSAYSVHDITLATQRKDGPMARQTSGARRLINSQAASPSASPVTIASCCSVS